MLAMLWRYHARMNRICDVVIIGGGLVGASLAIALDGSGLDVALVEAAAPRVERQPSHDERNLALARATVNALEALGVFNAQTPLTPIRRIHVSRRGDFGAVRLDAEALGLPPFGAVLPARELGNALLRRLDACRTLQRLAPATASAVGAAGDDIEVALAVEGVPCRMRSRLLVGADGTQSIVRDALGIGTQDHDYGQSLIVTTITVERALDGLAYERFTDTGPVALLPMGGTRAGLVLGVSSGDSARIAALDDAAFVAFVHERFGWRAGRLSRPGRRKPYPLKRRMAERLIAPRAVLVGNAAQTVHPLGAQGFNLGLRDALTLAELLRERGAGADPGDAALLARHVERRARDRAGTTSFSHDLVRAMASDALPLRLLRSLGFHAVDRIRPLARTLALRGMGFRGDVSEWGLSR